MHYHLEIIMPPTDDVEAAVRAIMEPFSEDNEDASHAFWDWYQIGGRYAGRKVEAQFDPETMKVFEEWMQSEKITVSGLQMGKQELSPSTQIYKVDKKWNELFPDSPLKQCPLFAHSNNNRGPLDGDVSLFKNLPKRLTAARVIVASPEYEENTGKHTGSPVVCFMISDQMWNGVTYVDTKWDSNVLTAVEMHVKKIEGYKEEYKEAATPKADWISVTVDYHS